MKVKYYSLYIHSIEKTDSSNIVIAVLGGDGSLGCFLDSIAADQMIKERLSEIEFTGLPYGTGNDTGRSMGWGADVNKKMQTLDHMVSMLVNGTREKFDLWEVEFYGRESYYYNSKGP